MHQKSFNMKLLILYFTLCISLFATTINDSLLQIHATLLPKIYLMDYSYKDKIDNNTIVIGILYNRVDYSSALSLKEKIDEKYTNGIKDYSIETKLIPYYQSNKDSANIYYLFPTKTKQIKKIIKKANIEKALTFSYLKDDLKHGVMISLNIGSKVKPILNLSAIKTNEISFRPILLKISKIYSCRPTGFLIYKSKKVSV